MSAKLNSVKLYNEFRPEAAAPLSNIDPLLFNIQDKVRAEIDVSFSEMVLASTDNPIIVNYTDGVLGDGWVYDAAGRFDNFKIGDVIRIGNYISLTTLDTRTIIDKTDNTLIRFDANVIGRPDDDVTTQDIFSIVSPITGINYYWNFIENSEALNFTSKVDGSTQLAFADTVDASDTVTLVPMEMVGSKCYQVGGITVQGISITDSYYYETRFKLIHNTYVTPFLEAILTSDVLTGGDPSYYAGTKCLKYVLKLEGFYQYTDVNRKQSVTLSDENGNSGYYNQVFNIFPPVYSVESVVYKKSDGVTVKESLERTTADQYVEVDLFCNNGSFSNHNTKFTVNIIKAPYDTTEYVGNDRYFRTNFCFDRALQTVGSSAVDGEEFGGVNQSLKDITAEFISSSEIKVRFRVAYAPEVLAIINESEVPYFQISIGIQDYTRPSYLADRQTVLVDRNEYFVDTSDPTMIGIATKFLRHYENDPETEGVASLEVFPGDEVVACSQFYIDRNGRETDDIRLKEVRMRVKAKDVVLGTNFTLDVKSYDLSTLAPVPPGSLPYPTLTANRTFHIPESEIRKAININRRPDLDDSGLYYYEVFFPFIFRWEYYEPLADVDPEFFYPPSPNNGQNHFWHHYQINNWKIYYELTIISTKNGEDQGYRQSTLIRSNNWNSSARWLEKSIKSYDNDTDAELYDSAIPRKYIQGYKNPRIEATFIDSLGGPLDLTGLVMETRIGKWETDTVSGVRRFSSIQAMTSDTYMESTDASNKIVMSLPASDTVVGISLLDHTVLPTFESFIIMARLYEKTPADETFWKLKESGEIKQLEDGQNKILE